MKNEHLIYLVGRFFSEFFEFWSISGKLILRAWSCYDLFAKNAFETCKN